MRFAGVLGHRYRSFRRRCGKEKQSMRAEIEIARQWVAKARNDLLNVDNNLASEHVPTDTV